MKKIFKSVLTLGLVAGLGFAANAQKTSTAPASATILTNLTITLESGTSIAFGSISATTPAAVVLDAKGLTNANTGSITDVAQFNLTGADTEEVTVTYDATVDLVSGDAVDPLVPTPAEIIVMTPEVVGAALSANQGTATAVASLSQVTLAGGIYFLWVGGSLPALTAKPTGTYSGTFNIDVEYN
jgi:hypothetical protein